MSCLSSCYFFKQKTAYEVRISDWSSDVCSSDLANRWHDRCLHLSGYHAPATCPQEIFCRPSVTAVAIVAQPGAHHEHTQATRIHPDRIDDRGRDHRHSGDRKSVV